MQNFQFTNYLDKKQNEAIKQKGRVQGMFESELFPESFDPFPHKVLISSKRFVMDFKSMKWIDQKGNCKGIKC